MDHDAYHRALDHGFSEREATRIGEDAWEDSLMNPRPYDRWEDHCFPMCDICGEHTAITGSNGYGVCSEHCSIKAESMKPGGVCPACGDGCGTPCDHADCPSGRYQETQNDH